MPPRQPEGGGPGKPVPPSQPTWTVQDWIRARPSDPGTQATLTLLLESFVTVMLKGAAGSAADGDVESVPRKDRERERVWEWRLESLPRVSPTKMRATQHSQDHSNTEAKQPAADSCSYLGEGLGCGDRSPLPESKALSNQGIG